MRMVPKRAFTLVELLVVLGIAMLLAALILPTVKTLLTERKSSSAAIMIKNYLEAARARAIGKNRSVAVVLERLSGRVWDYDDNGIINLADAVNPNYATSRFMSATAENILTANRTTVSADTNFLPYNTCIKLSMAEEPLPVTHKTIATPVNIQKQPVTSLPSVAYVGGESLADSDQAAWQLAGKPEDRTFSVTLPYPQLGVAPDADIAQLLGEYLVAGNEISFGESSQRFTIASPSLSSTHRSYQTSDPKKIWFSIHNERGAIGLNEQALRSYANINLPSTTSTATAFRIYQKPKPIYTQAIQLPKGTCVDLSLSGFGNNRPGLSGPKGLADYRVRFASDWVLAGTNGIPTPEELRPIYLVFAPDGSFSRVYANEQASPQSVRIDAVDDVFLHVGKIDQVNMAATGPTRDRAGLEAAVAADVKLNLVDPSSYVVRISPKSGAISAAPIQFRPYDAGDGNTLFDIIGNSRNGTFSSTVTGQ